MTFWILDRVELSPSFTDGTGGLLPTFGLGAAVLPGREGRLPAVPPPRPRDELERRLVETSEACESESRFPPWFPGRFTPPPRPPWLLEPLPPREGRLLRDPEEPSLVAGFGSDMSNDNQVA